MMQDIDAIQIKAVFLDAAGTLFHVTEPVGITYQRICAAHDITGEAADFEKGFRLAWKQHAPPFHPPRTRSSDDDKGWWRTLFQSAVHHAAHTAAPESAFEEAYAFYATAEAWTLYDDVAETLPKLAARWPLWVLSNFDRRLISVLDALGIRHWFKGIILSSEVGASKPHARMFETAIAVAELPAAVCLHIGDEDDADGNGARAAGLQAVILKRPELSMRELLIKLEQ